MTDNHVNCFNCSMLMHADCGEFAQANQYKCNLCK